MKKIINNLDVNYTHTVGFTADVGGRGFHLPRDLALNSENKLYIVSRSGAFHTAGLKDFQFVILKTTIMVNFLSLEKTLRTILAMLNSI